MINSTADDDSPAGESPTTLCTSPAAAATIESHPQFTVEGQNRSLHEVRSVPCVSMCRGYILSLALSDDHQTSHLRYLSCILFSPFLLYIQSTIHLATRTQEEVDPTSGSEESFCGKRTKRKLFFCFIPTLGIVGFLFSFSACIVHRAFIITSANGRANRFLWTRDWTGNWDDMR